uniref:Uncharacterized protein n=1 Tax=Arundo donax TaxID=35708 RepID=A0A0A9E112_ARUDO
MGEIKPLSYFRDMYRVDMTFYVDEIAQVLQDRFGDNGTLFCFSYMERIPTLEITQSLLPLRGWRSLILI